MSKPTHQSQDRPARATRVEPDDELVHVPKGASRLRFVILLSLTLFVLVIFTVGDQIRGTFSRRPTSEDYLSWVHPARGQQSMSGPKFMEAKRALANFYFVAQGGRSREGADDEVAYQLITERIAQEAGVEVPDVELRRAIREGEPGLVRAFLDRDTYRATLKQAGVSPQAYEATLRRVLRVRRYETMVAMSLAAPTPSDLEKAYKESHQEHAFDLAGLAPADVRAEAEASAPDADGLKAWYEALSEGDKARLFLEKFLPVRSSAALLSWRINPQLPQALLDRYPRPEKPSVDELASMYHARFGAVRFPAAAQETPAPPEGEQTPPPPSARPLEEVKDQAAAEAQVHAALEALLRDLKAKVQAGESPDVAALAAELGLESESDETLRSNDEWNTQKGSAVGGLVALTQPGQFSPSTAVDAERITLVRVVERKASEAPPFDAVADVAAAKWVDERAKKLVEEKLKALSEKLTSVGTRPAPKPDAKRNDPPPPPVIDAESFARETEAAGVTVVHQDWFDPAQRIEDMEGLPEAERFLRFSYYPGAELFSLEDGAFIGPLPSAQDERQWIARSAGKRDPATVEIKPADYESLSQQALYTRLQDVILGLRSLERLQRDFQVRFPAVEHQKAEEAKREQEKAGA
jgi:hypothetical protein